MTHPTAALQDRPLDALATPGPDQLPDDGAFSDEEVEGARLGWLPVAPLVEMVEGRGGLAACGIRRDEGGEPERLAKAYYRAQARGRITIWAADRLSVKALRLLPSGVWGQLWYLVGSDGPPDDLDDAAAPTAPRNQVTVAPRRRAAATPPSPRTRPALSWAGVAVAALAAHEGELSARQILDWNDSPAGPGRPHNGKTPLRSLNRDLHTAARRPGSGIALGSGPGLFRAG